MCKGFICYVMHKTRALQRVVQTIVSESVHRVAHSCGQRRVQIIIPYGPISDGERNQSNRRRMYAPENFGVLTDLSRQVMQRKGKRPATRHEIIIRLSNV